MVVTSWVPAAWADIMGETGLAGGGCCGLWAARLVRGEVGGFGIAWDPGRRRREFRRRVPNVWAALGRAWVDEGVGGGDEVGEVVAARASVGRGLWVPFASATGSMSLGRLSTRKRRPSAVRK